MIGGPNSFGAGGWSNTELEKAMPVDFQIKNAKVRAVGDEHRLTDDPAFLREGEAGECESAHNGRAKHVRFHFRSFLS